MGSVLPDVREGVMERLWIEIEYWITKQENVPKITIHTNIKQHLVSGLLMDWVQDQMGRGVDESKAEDKEVYNIRIQIDLSDDTFYTKSDTGNKGLTCGIVADVARRFDEHGLPGGEVVFA